VPVEPDLADAYELAWDEWIAADDADPWDAVVGDGLDPEDAPSTRDGATLPASSGVKQP
jgi:hypothetical protein